ncbi:putative low-complexity protein [Leptolyngbya sp. PCC 7375]|nr:putative low-complexity protein [Leptolyngbya sp. PCC 7375]
MAASICTIFDEQQSFIGIWAIDPNFAPSIGSLAELLWLAEPTLEAFTTNPYRRVPNKHVEVGNGVHFEDGAFFMLEDYAAPNEALSNPNSDIAYALINYQGVECLVQCTRSDKRISTPPPTAQRVQTSTKTVDMWFKDGFIRGLPYSLKDFNYLTEIPRNSLEDWVQKVSTKPRQPRFTLVRIEDISKVTHKLADELKANHQVDTSEVTSLFDKYLTAVCPQCFGGLTGDGVQMAAMAFSNKRMLFLGGDQRFQRVLNGQCTSCESEEYYIAWWGDKNFQQQAYSKQKSDKELIEGYAVYNPKYLLNELLQESKTWNPEGDENPETLEKSDKELIEGHDVFESEHLNQLMQGSEIWNKWRDENPGICPDLSGADLRSADLTEADLSRANLSEANLCRAKLCAANLEGSNLSRANLSGADMHLANLNRTDLRGAVLCEAKLTRVTLEEANLSGANLSDAAVFEANLSRANLSGAKLYKTYLVESNLIGANLSETDLLNGASLSESKLTRDDLTKMNLRETNLHGINLSGADLSKMDFTGVNLRGANLRKTNLCEANLNSAELNQANLSEANLRKANLSKAKLLGTNLQGADLRGVTLTEINLSEVNLHGAIISEAALNKINLAKTNLCGINLSDADLSKMNLSEANLSEANLSKANLRETNLHKTNLSKANLSKTDFSGANLSGANLSGTNLRKADLSKLNLKEINLTGANLNGANLSEADLSRTNLSKANLGKANLGAANLEGANLTGSNLNKTDLHQANLNGTDLTGANLNEANLDEVNLHQAKLTKAKLIKVDLRKTKLNKTDLCEIDLRESNLSKINLSKTNLSRTQLAGTNLSFADLRESNLSKADLYGADLSQAMLCGANLKGADLSEAKLNGSDLNKTIFIEAKGLSTSQIAALKERGGIFSSSSDTQIIDRKPRPGKPVKSQLDMKPKYLITAAVILCLGTTIYLGPKILSYASDERAWGEAISINTIQHYNSYKLNFPKGRHLEDADKNSFSVASQENNIKLFNQYLRNFPNGNYVNEANKSIVEIASKPFLITEGFPYKREVILDIPITVEITGTTNNTLTANSNVIVPVEGLTLPSGSDIPPELAELAGQKITYGIQGGPFQITATNSGRKTSNDFDAVGVKLVFLTEKATLHASRYVLNQITKNATIEFKENGVQLTGFEVIDLQGGVLGN